MKITKIECFPVKEMFRKPFTMRGDTKTYEPGMIVKLHTDEGIVGIADSGGTSAWYRGELIETMMAMINRTFAPVLLGEDPFNIEKIIGMFDLLARDNNQAKAVIDYALHDIMGKALGVPVYQLLGGKCRENVPLAYVLPAAGPDEVVDMAQKSIAAGFKAVKLKISGESDLTYDLNNVAALREALGDDAEIFVDANGAWNYYQALMFLKKPERYNLAMIEQPLPWWDVDGMAKLRQKVGTPVFADEGVVELKHLIEFGQKQACDGVFIKVTKAGGLLKSKRFITIARSLDMPVLCGCMMGSGIEAATYAHLLIADDWMGLAPHENIGPLQACDMFDTVQEKVTDNLAVELPRYENGCLYAPEKPGLGMELNEEALERCAIPDIPKTCVELKK